jgi:hypothetical protein
VAIYKTHATACYPIPLCILNSEFHSSFLSQFVFLRSVRRLLVTANVVNSSPILVTMMMETLSSSETPILSRATRRNIPKDTILQGEEVLMEVIFCVLRRVTPTYPSLHSCTHISWTRFHEATLETTNEVKANSPQCLWSASRCGHLVPVTVQWWSEWMRGEMGQKQVLVP